MARRRRRGKLPVFQAIFGVTVVAGIALFDLPKSPLAILVAVLAIALFSAIATWALVRLLRRPAIPREPETDLYEIWKRREPTFGPDVDTSKWSLDLLKQLEWRRFEEVCAAYFEALNLRAVINQFGADGGIDITLYSSDSETPRALVQCKAWNTTPVGVKPVRELRGVMAARKIAKGIFVTSGTFTKDAKEFATQEGIHLLEGDLLVEKLLALPAEKNQAVLQVATQGDFTTPTCPSCGVKMTRRESRKDGRPFWGCVNYPRCHQTLA